jgi:hypothetical protein
MVLCVDEKPGSQALERKPGYIQTDKGKTVRAYKSTYKRHGTLNWLAALEVATGTSQGQITETKKREDFQSVMDSVISEYSPEQEIQVVRDNYCPHKNNADRLGKPKNVYFHYPRRSASGLHPVEIRLGIFSRKALRGTSFASPSELKQRIEDFISQYNPNSKPFKWRKREVKGSQIKDNIANLVN